MEIEWASLGRAALFLGIPFVLLTYYFQWRWARTCEKNIWVLVAKAGGGGEWNLAPKEGGHVSIRNPYSEEVRTWPINELATIEVLYPGVGFVPKYLQKSIRLAVVNEGDWEPILNRSPHRKKIASPDVIEYFLELAERFPDLAKEMETYLSDMSSSPTRELIADPEGIGNLMRMGVLRALATVSDDLLEALKGIRTQLTRFAGINGTYVYIGLGLTLILVAFLVYQVMQTSALTDTGDMADKINQIHRSLGLGTQ